MFGSCIVGSLSPFYSGNEPIFDAMLDYAVLVLQGRFTL